MSRLGAALFASLVFCLLAAPSSALALGSISGEVSDFEHPSTKLSNVKVCAFSTEVESRCTQTVSGGTYMIANLQAAKYIVAFDAVSQHYAVQYWKEVPFAEEATELTVSSSSSTPNINAALQIGGAIAGVVTGAPSGTPLSGVEVCVYSAEAWTIPICSSTNANGTYEVLGLTTGEFEVTFEPDETQYFGQLYNGLSLEEEFGTPVSVTAPNTHSGINAVLKPVHETTTKPGGTSTGTTPTPSPPTTTTPSPKPLKCKKGFKKKTVKGKAKCVKAHKAKHHGKKHHRRALLGGYVLG